MNRQNEILAELALIHQQWYAEMEDQVEPNLDDSHPHDGESGESDYALHHVDVSCSPDQEAILQERIAGLYTELREMGQQ